MIKLIAFDFDGTLADSVDFCLDVYDRVFAEFMKENAPDREEVYQAFGMNEPGVIRHFIGRFLPEAEERFYQLHRELHPGLCPEVFPGCRELLDFIKELNVPMAIITGRAETTCKISMEMLDLEEYFIGFQYGSPEKNDKSAQLRKLMQQYNLQNDEIIYIGDAVSDVQASHNAQVKCLAAAWAKTARVDELEKINPGLVFTRVEDMQKFLSENIAR